MAPRMSADFSATARLLEGHIKDAEDRLSAFERCSQRELRAAIKAQDSSVAAAQWWWKEYTSVKDAIKSLIDGKIRHEYDRPKAVRTPNHLRMDWQKAGLRTGESQDNLRRLLIVNPGSKHEGEFDALNLRIEALQENIKRVRDSLVQAVRTVRVNKFGEETQELRLRLRNAAGGGDELRLFPPCGNSLEECTCGARSSPPQPVRDDSLRGAIVAAKKAAPAAAAVEVGGGAGRGKRGNDDDDNRGGGNYGRGVTAAAAAERQAKKKRVSGGPEDGDGGDGDDSRRPPRGGVPRGWRQRQAWQAPSANASDVPLDEIKRQMGKNPLELERRKAAFEKESRDIGRKSAGGGGGGRSGAHRGRISPAAPSKGIAGTTNRGVGGRAVDEIARDDRGHGDDGGGLQASEDDDQAAGRAGEDTEEEEEEDWRDDLMGMLPHERAEAYEERGLFREALKWHREDLIAARARALDGEEEDEREASLDLARALRNTGRCLGRLGNSGFAESKRHLTEARDLVGPDGPSPCPAAEQDVVLELGNLWYNRYLLCDGHGLRFLVDEALGAALGCYRESRELCVDLVADSGEGAAEEVEDADAAAEAVGRGRGGAAAVASGCLLRAEYNVGMTLFEQDKRAEAARHLSAAVAVFEHLFGGGGRRREPGDFRQTAPGSAGGVGGGGREGGTLARESRAGAEVSATLAAWKTAALEREELVGLGGVYASSLFLLGECLASSAPASTSKPACAFVSGDKRSPPRVMEILEASSEAFLEIEAPARALDPIRKLVETLRKQWHSQAREPEEPSGGDGMRYLRTVGALCDRVLIGLPPPPPHVDDDDLADERLQLEEAREEIAGLLRARRRTAGEVSRGDGGGSNGSSGGAPERRDGGQQDAAGPSEVQEHDQGGEDGGAATVLSQPSLHRVGPLPTAGFAQRRRRSRAAAAVATQSGSAQNSAPGVAASNTSPSAESRREAAVAGGSVARRLHAVPAATSLHPGRAGSEEEAWPAGEYAGSFAGLRAAVAAEDGAGAMSAAALVVASGAVSVTEGWASGEGQDGRKSTCDLYMEKCRDLQERPNPFVSARLSLADRGPGVLAATATTSMARAAGSGDDRGSSSSPELFRGHRFCRRLTLDLRACRLTDRESRVLLHVLSDRRAADKPIAAAAAAAAGAAEETASERTMGAMTQQPVRFVSLLLGENPGIGAGALGALRDGGMLLYLERLELPRCGLTAADLAGFAPPIPASLGDGGGMKGAEPQVVRLRELVLRDNPLTRIMGGGGGGGGGWSPGAGSKDWIEAARRGVAALRDLIARAPALELLDVSGCSQLPEGTAGRLYSPRVSDLLASALSSGLEARVGRKLASSSVDVDGDGGDGSDGDRGGGGGNGGDGGGDDGRAQVAAIRVGNNSFSRQSWRLVLETLSSHPPRELDLSYAWALLPPEDGAERKNTAGPDATSSSSSSAAAMVEAAAGYAAGGESTLAPPESVDDSLPSDSRPAPAQPLGDLLAAAILPADAPGVEILNLTGSTGLLLDPCPLEQYREEADGDGAGDGESSSEPSSPPLLSSTSSTCAHSSCSSTAFLMLLRDALVSPLCRVTHLLLAGVTGCTPPFTPRPGEALPDSPRPSVSTGRTPRVFRPQEARSLCVAASACATMRCLDLAGCDLSGPTGAAAAAAVAACLLRAHDGDGGFGAPVAAGDLAGAVAVAAGAGGLDRLSLRACGLGAFGLSAVLRALVPGDESERGEGVSGLLSRRRLPRLLDLSDNRPLGAAGGDDVVRRDRGAGGAAEAEGVAAALSNLAASVRELEHRGLASVVVAGDPRRSLSSIRHRTLGNNEPALIDLSGNRIDFAVENA